MCTLAEALAKEAAGREHGRSVHLRFMATMSLAAVGLGLSALALILFGTAFANVPLHRLGQNRGAGYTTRCLGYDVARGEFFTPPHGKVGRRPVLPFGAQPGSHALYSAVHSVVFVPRSASGIGVAALQHG